MEQDVNTLLGGGLTVTFIGLEVEASWRVSSNFAFSSSSFIRASRLPNKSSVCVSGFVVSALYFEGNAALKPLYVIGPFAGLRLPTN